VRESVSVSRARVSFRVIGRYSVLCIYDMKRQWLIVGIKVSLGVHIQRCAALRATYKRHAFCCLLIKLRELVFALTVPFFFLFYFCILDSPFRHDLSSPRSPCTPSIHFGRTTTRYRCYSRSDRPTEPTRPSRKLAQNRRGIAE